MSRANVTITMRRTPDKEAMQFTFPGGPSGLIEFIVEPATGQRIVKLSQVDPEIRIHTNADDERELRWAQEKAANQAHWDAMQQKHVPEAKYPRQLWQNRYNGEQYAVDVEPYAGKIVLVTAAVGPLSDDLDAANNATDVLTMDNLADFYEDPTIGQALANFITGQQDNFMFIKSVEPHDATLGAEDDEDWSIGDPLGNEQDIITDDDDGIRKTPAF